MSEDLELPIEGKEEDGIVEFTTREEYINCACYALATVETINTMTASDTAKVNRIKRKCLKIIDELVCEMFDELHEKDEDDE
jgi:hypothetical protein